jgi:hypothetical protein
MFATADEIVIRSRDIDSTLATAGGDTRRETAALSNLFGGVPPRWPEYDTSRVALSDEGVDLWWDVYWEVPPSEDGIELFAIEELRAKAKVYGVKGRSKAEIAKRLRTVAPDAMLAELEHEGRSTWEAANQRRELQKFYAVLAHGVTLASYSIQNLALLESGVAERIKWSSGPCCKKCTAADGMSVVVGRRFPHVDVMLTPAHPGCNCVIIADFDC